MHRPLIETQPVSRFCYKVVTNSSLLKLHVILVTSASFLQWHVLPLPGQGSVAVGATEGTFATGVTECDAWGVKTECGLQWVSRPERIFNGRTV
jgi:hypothetical protein